MAPESSEQPPNILFLLADHHRWDWLGATARTALETPHLDRLADHGTVLTGCRVSSPLCAPSRACLATGLRYERAGVPDNYTDLDPTRPTFMRQLRDHGYSVSVCGKADLHKGSTELFTVDGWSRRLGQLGFTGGRHFAGKRDRALVRGWPTPLEPYMAYLASRGLSKTVHDDYQKRAEFEDRGLGVPTWPSPVPVEHHIEEFGGRAACDLLRHMPKEAPWFLQVNFGGPHPPFDAPAEFVDAYRDAIFPTPVAPGDGPSDHLAVRRQYAAMLSQMDVWVGRLLDILDQRGERPRTFIVYTSDHGDMLGDHGLWNKGRAYEGSVRVPLIVAGPGIEAGDVDEDALIESIDLAATILDWAGAPAIPNADAQSLVPYLSGGADVHRLHTLSALQGWRMVTDGRWKLIRDRSGESCLFDLDQPVAETNDLAGREPEIVELLSRLIP